MKKIIYKEKKGQNPEEHHWRPGRMQRVRRQQQQIYIKRLDKKLEMSLQKEGVKP